MIDLNEAKTDEQIDKLVQLTRRIVDNQNKERELLGKILLGVAFRGRTYTHDETEVRSYELLKAAGLPTPSLGFNASRVVRRNELKRRMDAEKAARDEANS